MVFRSAWNTNFTGIGCGLRLTKKLFLQIEKIIDNKRKKRMK